MSTRRTKATGPLTQEVILVNATGLTLGTPEAPLQTATSSLQTTSDLTVTRTATSTATTTTITGTDAVAAQFTRVYRLRIDVAAAQTLTFNAAVSDTFTFAGAGHYVYDFATRPWFMTAVNTPFTVTTTTTAATVIVCEFTKAA